MTPKLSVIMPNYNMSKYFVEALDSVFSQTFKDFEVLFIDDCSTDNSLAVIEEYRRNHPEIQLLRNEKNLGAVSTVNRGLQEAQGELIFFFAADDIILDPTFFERSIGHLEQHPSFSFCTSDHGMFFDGSKEIKSWRVFPHLDHFTPITASEFMTLCRKKCLAPCGLYFMGAIFRREIFTEKFSNDFPVLSDWYLIHLFALKTGCLYLPSVSIVWRKRGKENLHHFRRKDEALKLLLHISQVKEHRKLFQRSRILKEMVREARKQGQLTFRPKLWSLVIPLVMHKFDLKMKKVLKLLS